MDPMAGSSPDMTPYHYCRNNPVILFDPDGSKELNALKYGRSLNGTYASGLDYSGVRSDGTGWVVINEGQMVCNELIARAYYGAGYTDFPAANNEQIQWFRNQGWFTTDPSRGEPGDAMYFQQNGDINAREEIHVVMIADVKIEKVGGKYIVKYKFKHAGRTTGTKEYDNYYTAEEIGQVFAGRKKFIGIGSKPDNQANSGQTGNQSAGHGTGTNGQGSSFWDEFKIYWRAVWGR